MSKERPPVFLYGASGHAKVVLDVLAAAGQSAQFLLDDAADMHGQTLCGVPVLGGRKDLRRHADPKQHLALVSIGDNQAREQVALWLAEQGFKFASLVHPGAVISNSVRLGSGSVVMAGAVINADSRVGDHVIINTGATVDHDCDIGDYVHVAPGCTLCGNVGVGIGCLLGAGSTLVPGMDIGARGVVGAGATVIRSVAAGQTVVGTPAVPLRG